MNHYVYFAHASFPIQDAYAYEPLRSISFETAKNGPPKDTYMAFPRLPIETALDVS